MAFRIKRQEAVSTAVQRIANEQLGKAASELEDLEAPVAATVHQVRKRCKKLRGLVRLVRPAFNRYQAENAAFRDAARLLSNVRDAQVYGETYDAVMEHFDRQLNRAAFGSIRAQLTRQRKTLVEEEADLQGRLEQFRSEIETARQRLAQWKLDAKGYDAVRGGLAKTYSRAVKALSRCERGGAAEDYHEWRKRAKYHWYHCRILNRTWPDVVQLRQKQMHHLSDWLGDAHDLAVLARQIEEDRTSYGAAADVEAFLGLVRQRRQDIEQKSLQLGKKIFAESADAFAERIGRYWKLWRSST